MVQDIKYFKSDGGRFSEKKNDGIDLFIDVVVLCFPSSGKVKFWFIHRKSYIDKIIDNVLPDAIFQSLNMFCFLYYLSLLLFSFTLILFDKI